MKKILLIIALAIPSLFVSCSEEEVFSCNPDIDKWAKENLSTIKTLTRNDWLEIGDPEQARACYIAFSPSQKRNFWLEKLSSVLLFDWTPEERAHIQKLKDYVATSMDFSGEMSEQHASEFDKFMYLWISDAEDSFNWSSSLIYSMLARGENMIDKNGTLEENKNKSNNASRILTPTPNCDCSRQSDYCGDRFSRVPGSELPSLIVATCSGTGCSASNSGCGLLFAYSCNGTCQIISK